MEQLNFSDFFNKLSGKSVDSVDSEDQDLIDDMGPEGVEDSVQIPTPENIITEPDIVIETPEENLKIPEDIDYDISVRQREEIMVQPDLVISPHFPAVPVIFDKLGACPDEILIHRARALGLPHEVAVGKEPAVRSRGVLELPVVGYPALHIYQPRIIVERRCKKSVAVIRPG